MVSFAIALFCPCSTKTTIDNTEMNGYSCVPGNLIYINRSWLFDSCHIRKRLIILLCNIILCLDSILSIYLDKFYMSCTQNSRVFIHLTNLIMNDLFVSTDIVILCFFLPSLVFPLSPAVPCPVHKKGNVQLAELETDFATDPGTSRFLYFSLKG